MVDYNKKVMDYFLNPKNMGEIKNPTVSAQVGNPVCGDVMKIYLKIDKKNGKEYIKEVKFKTLGCAAAIATSSALTEIAKGLDLKKARKISKKDVVKKLGGLPDIKIHCSNLADQALKKAIKKHMEKKKDVHKK